MGEELVRLFEHDRIAKAMAAALKTQPADALDRLNSLIADIERLKQKIEEVNMEIRDV